MFSKIVTPGSAGVSPEQLERLRQLLDGCDAVVIGAGAGLSTSAGFVYSGPRFEAHFADFRAKYGFRDMYSGGFYPYTTAEEHWAYWSRYIYVNRYMDPPKPVYDRLLELVREKDCFVLTTNVDHCFQKAGFDKERLFYTQGDFGLWQCAKPCHDATYDNEETVRKMVLAQGYTIADNGELVPPESGKPLMRVPSELIPRCPKCGRPMTMNLRADDTFVEDKGWYAAAKRYEQFLRRHADAKTLFLELGVGGNTPVIIKYPFWQMTHRNPNAAYACVNLGEAAAPLEIVSRSVCMDGDIGEVVEKLHI